MAAHITGSITASSSNVNMTSLGAEDYHIYDSGAGSWDTGQRKSGGGSLISVSMYNPGNAGGNFSESKTRTLSATDATPTASFSSSNVYQHIFWGGTLAGSFGYSITLPAGTGTRTAKLYFFAYCGTGDDVNTQFEAYVTVSDSSTSPVTLATPFYTANTDVLYTIDLDYAAASAGQTLTVVFRAKDTTNGSARAVGYHGVWVSAAASGGPTNVNLTATSSATVGRAISIARTISDTVTTSAVSAKEARISRLVSVTVTTTISRLRAIALNTAATIVATARKMISRNVSVASSASASVARQLPKILADVVSVVVNMTSGRPVNLTTSVTSSVVYRRAVIKIQSVTTSAVGNLARTLLLVRSVSITTNANIVKLVSKTISDVIATIVNLVSVGNNTRSYRYYRFNTTARRGGGTGIIQLAEFSLFNAGTRVYATTVTAPGSSSPVNEEPPKANDNNTHTKFLSMTMLPLIYDFGASQATNSYSITTANDAADRDPVRWLLEGSDNGTDWDIIDDKTGSDYPTPTARFTSSPVINFPNLGVTILAALETVVNSTPVFVRRVGSVVVNAVTVNAEVGKSIATSIIMQAVSAVLVARTYALTKMLSASSATTTLMLPALSFTLQALSAVNVGISRLISKSLRVYVSALAEAQRSFVYSRLEDLSIYVITLIRDTIAYVTGENNVIIVPKETNVAEGWTGIVVEDFATIFAFDTDFESTI